MCGDERPISLVDLARKSVILLVDTTEERTQTQMAQVTITQAVRKKIKDNIAYATTHRLREGQVSDEALEGLDAVTITPQIRVRYVEHQMSDRVMAHLSIHANPNSQLDEQIVEQLAQEYGLGPRAGWAQELKDHPPAPSSHVFKTLSGSTA